MHIRKGQKSMNYEKMWLHVKCYLFG